MGDSEHFAWQWKAGNIQDKHMLENRDDMLVHFFVFC